MFYTFADADPHNTRHYRNIGNISRRQFNCAGYALGCFSWYCPHTEEDDMWSDKIYAYRTRDLEARTRARVQQILCDFPDLREISNPDETAEDEFAIAFRLSTDGDFHFIWRDNRNHWWQKMGALSELYQIRKSEVFSSLWGIRYNGPIVFFARKWEMRGV